jgi:xanthine dehydrogenase accessory factor
MSSSKKRVLVRGLGAFGSAVAHKLFVSGYLVVIHDTPRPTHIRRGMAFVDAAFDGEAWLDGVGARRLTDPASVEFGRSLRKAILVYTGNFQLLLSALRPDIVIDARMRGAGRAEYQKDCAQLVIGVGPGFVAGEHVDCAVETDPSDAGRLVISGPTHSLREEPHGVAGRGRLVHAPKAGVFSTTLDVGDHVDAGDLVATVDTVELRSPLTGVLSGIVYNGVAVAERAAVIEVDPRSDAELIRCVGDRPRCVADGVLEAITRLTS